MQVVYVCQWQAGQMSLLLCGWHHCPAAHDRRQGHKLQGGVGNITHAPRSFIYPTPRVGLLFHLWRRRIAVIALLRCHLICTIVFFCIRASTGWFGFYESLSPLEFYDSLSWHWFPLRKSTFQRGFLAICTLSHNYCTSSAELYIFSNVQMQMWA